MFNQGTVICVFSSFCHLNCSHGLGKSGNFHHFHLSQVPLQSICEIQALWIALGQVPMFRSEQKACHIEDLPNSDCYHQTLQDQMQVGNLNIWDLGYYLETRRPSSSMSPWRWMSQLTLRTMPVGLPVIRHKARAIPTRNRLETLRKLFSGYLYRCGDWTEIGFQTNPHLRTFHLIFCNLFVVTFTNTFFNY